jgi:Ca2+:H+ antiporter
VVLLLLAVVLLAETFSHVVDAATAWIGAPTAFAGLVVAALILLPESIAAISAARATICRRASTSRWAPRSPPLG